MADRKQDMTALKPLKQVATPRADIRSRKFDASVFAADLGEVLAGRGPRITATPPASSARPT